MSSEMAFPLGLREVIPNQTVPNKTKDVFVINTGGAQSTLQEIRLSDGAGGFTYSPDHAFPFTRNRFVHWRTSGDLLELSETSLDHALLGNRVRYRFQDAPVLSSGGVSVHEAGANAVVVLVATVATVHKMVFPHPRRIHKQNPHLVTARGAAGVPSIFAESSHAQAKENCHAIPSPAGTSPLPHLATSWLCPSTGDAYFVLANSAGEIQLVKVGNVKGMVVVNQLKSGSYLGRLWGSLGGRIPGVGAAMTGGGSGGEAPEAPTGLTIQAMNGDVFVFGVCRDHKLRMWSTSSCDCVLAADLLAFTAKGDSRNVLPQQGTQSHLIRQVNASEGSNAVSIALFLCLSKQSQFCVVRPAMVDGQYQLNHVATIYAPELDLVDFQVSRDHVWALWTNPEGLPVLRYASFSPGGGAASCYSGGGPESSAGPVAATGWVHAALEEPLDPELLMLEEEDDSDGSRRPLRPRFDPRQTYMREIFMPGRFSMQTLARTISIYRRSLNVGQPSQGASGSSGGGGGGGGSGGEDDGEDRDLTFSRLREEVSSVVETEIQSRVSAYEVSDEEYLSVSHQAWARFLSCASQYHQSGVSPLGLVCDGPTGLVCLIKKAGFSFLRPVDALEQMVISGQGQGMGASSYPLGPEIFVETPILREDPSLCRDVLGLMRAAALVSAHGRALGPALHTDFSRALSRLVSPDQAARAVVHAVLQEDSASELTQEVAACLQHVGDVAKALEVLIISLELDRGIVSHAEEFETSSSSSSSSTSEAEMHATSYDLCVGGGRKSVFASPLGISVVAVSLNQMAQTRFDLTRDLLVLQQLVLECESVCAEAAAAIHSALLPRTVVMAHCYFVLAWLTETVASAPPPNSLEQGMRQMAVLRLNGGADHLSSAHMGAESLAQLARSSQRPLTLAELFLRGPGGARARQLLAVSSGGGTGATGGAQHHPHGADAGAWRSALAPLVSITAQLLWPRCVVPALQEFLLSACQHMQIQEYVRLLSTWCDWNCHSRQFLLGSALLSMGEPEKAVDWMEQAAGGVPTDRFLMSHLFTSEEEKQGNEQGSLQVLYFLKVIELFEQFGYYDFVVELAKTALDVCDLDNPNRMTLCYILFSHHLKLGHNSDAYDAMIINPDQSRRRDSLRQFVVTLFERKQLRELASFPYVDMFDDFEQIIEARARSADLMLNNYYDFLYSFHIMKENYRKAALVMYECGMRLGTEVFTPEGLQKQAKCYLACLNCLKLVNEKYSWIVKPVPHSTYVPQGLPPGTSPKRTVDGEELERELAGEANGRKPKMDVLEMDDIEKEFELVCARLKLARKSSSLVSGPGLSPSETLSLLVSVNLFEDAVQISKLFDLDPTPILEGLTSKCVHLSRASAHDRDAAWEWLAESETGGADLRGTGPATEAAWALLRDVIRRTEKERQSSGHRAVVSRLFSLGAEVPAWLSASYKRRNAAELLRLFHAHGFLEEASSLAVEYLSAALGDGKEYFGLSTSLNANSPPVWVPVTAVEQLMMELELNQNVDPLYKKLLDRLTAKVEQYLQAVERVSADLIALNT